MPALYEAVPGFYGSDASVSAVGVACISRADACIMRVRFWNSQACVARLPVDGGAVIHPQAGRVRGPAPLRQPVLST